MRGLHKKDFCNNFGLESVLTCGGGMVKTLTVRFKLENSTKRKANKQKPT